MSEKNIVEPKIVVVTPVKNEEWILERFLSVTSQFADLIIVADQNSTDSSREIFQKYSKVHLIENKSNQYDESSRQILLIETARNLVPEHKIILALDSDEILAADALNTQGWQTMLQAKPGTILCFEKPDLYLTPDQCIRYTQAWPLGYVDDGVEHKPKKVHSIRVPQPDYAEILYIHDVKILHYALTRPHAQASKIRFYSVTENVLKTKSFFHRFNGYSSQINWLERGQLDLSDQKWFLGWESIGIDMRTIKDTKYYWWDFEVLTYFESYGCFKFWFDDIWDFEWEKFYEYAQTVKPDTKFKIKIISPSQIFITCLKIIVKIIKKTKLFVKKFLFF